MLIDLTYTMAQSEYHNVPWYLDGTPSYLQWYYHGLCLKRREIAISKNTLLPQYLSKKTLDYGTRLNKQEIAMPKKHGITMVPVQKHGITIVPYVQNTFVP